MPWHRVLPAVIVIAALAGVYGLAMTGHQAPATAQPPGALRSVPVTAVERGCPGLGLPGTGSGRVALIAAPAAGGPGQAVVRNLADAAAHAPLFTTTQPGRFASATIRPAGRPAGAGAANGTPITTAPAGGGVVVQATGAMARGLAVEQTAADGTPTGACASPGTDFWFTGPGQHTVGQIQLYLMNPADQAASVSVEIATDAGPLQGSTDTGIAVAPHSMVVQSLAPAVRTSRVVSLHVQASVGQVVAGVEETTGNAASGAWLPAAQAPATTLVVPGLPAAAGTRQLFVSVPGQRDAHVTIKAVTSRGTYEPTGGGGLDVPSGSAVEIDLPALGGIPAAIALTSSQPVTASVMIPGGPAGAPGTFTAAAPPLQQQGVVAANLTGGNGSSQVVLSAPQGAATVQVQELAGTAAGTPQTVTVPAGRTTVVSLTAPHGTPRGAPLSVVISPQAGSGPVYAGRAAMGAGSGTVQALMPVPSALTTVPLPAVRPAPITAQP